MTCEANPECWDLIRRSEARPRVGGALNSWLNAHGLPLVHRPDGAYHVLLNFGLNYLVIDSLLVSKLARA